MFSQNSVPHVTHQRRRGRRRRGLSRRRTSVIQRSGQLSLVQEVVQLWQEVPVGWLRAAPTHHVGQTVALSVLGGASERADIKVTSVSKDADLEVLHQLNGYFKHVSEDTIRTWCHEIHPSHSRRASIQTGSFLNPSILPEVEAQSCITASLFIEDGLKIHDGLKTSKPLGLGRD